MMKKQNAVGRAIQALMLKKNAVGRAAQAALVAALVSVSFADPAFAQLDRATTVLTNVQTILTGVAVVVTTIAILWAGFKMLFQHHKWSEIAHIVIGGLFIGGAAGFASWLIG
jgi:type IV secretion system protein VirB2